MASGFAQKIARRRTAARACRDERPHGGRSGSPSTDEVAFAVVQRVQLRLVTRGGERLCA
jgi:hypothetical protein